MSAGPRTAADWKGVSVAGSSPGRWTGADWQGVSVAVWGAARSGIAAANLLVELGARVVLSDSRPRAELGLEGLDPGVEVLGGGNAVGTASVVIPSPGIPPGAPVFELVRAAGARLVSEVELAAGLAAAPLVAITGTDGKTTTTEMIGAISRASGRATVVAGNIGVPLSQEVRSVDALGIVVAEISAFQLWSAGYFRPAVSVVTNVAPDHLDYFGGDWSAYVAAKARVLADQSPGDTAVLRGDDALVAAMSTPTGVARVHFGLRADFEWGFDGTSLLRRGRPVLAVAELLVEGRHNVCNALAALAVGEALGLPLEPALEALRAFRGLPHRMERVRVLRGVTFIDDSKATNPHAARVGLRSLAGPYVAIVGGFDKGLDQTELVEDLVRNARAVVVIGGTAARTASELAGRVPTHTAATLDEAVGLAAHAAREGDAVVLSPAASSFDLYRDYHHRGQVYQAAVMALPE